jgi:hypothetical protein
MPKYLVETVSMFRMRYVVEALEDTHACDTVIMDAGGLEEFSQLHLDEIITSTREIDDAEYLKLFDQDNDYLKDWDDSLKFRRVHVLDYEN